MMKEKATACQKFEYLVLEGTNHNYEGNEQEMAEVVVNWMERQFKVGSF
ncbi:hypothetical protein [uncultured Rossellomorea sp.]|nr:hypothetical protein [uncultured Rossellomorea sp.]